MSFDGQIFVRLFAKELKKRTNRVVGNESESELDVRNGRLCLVLDIVGARGSEGNDITLKDKYPLEAQSITVPAGIFFSADIELEADERMAFWNGMVSRVVKGKVILALKDETAFANSVQMLPIPPWGVGDLEKVQVNLDVSIGDFTTSSQTRVFVGDVFDRVTLKRLVTKAKQTRPTGRR
jgi:hypothetical protein